MKRSPLRPTRRVEVRGRKERGSLARALEPSVSKAEALGFF